MPSFHSSQKFKDTLPSTNQAVVYCHSTSPFVHSHEILGIPSRFPISTDLVPPPPSAPQSDPRRASAHRQLPGRLEGAQRPRLPLQDLVAAQGAYQGLPVHLRERDCLLFCFWVCALVCFCFCLFVSVFVCFLVFCFVISLFLHNKGKTKGTPRTLWGVPKRSRQAQIAADQRVATPGLSRGLATPPPFSARL